MKNILKWIILLAISVSFVELIGRQLITTSTCFDERTYHRYCGSLNGLSKGNPIDNVKPIPMLTNADGVRIGDEKLINTRTNLANVMILNIGDSFLQAEKIHFEETLGQRIQSLSGTRTLDVGFSSWAPINYLGWLVKHRPRPHVAINIFAMVNDFQVGGNINYYSSGAEIDEAGYPIFRKVLSTELKRSSFIYRVYEQLHKMLLRYRIGAIYENSDGDPEVKDYSYSRMSDNCRLLTELDAPPGAMSYIVFAFNPRCWSPNIKRAVTSAVLDLEKICKMGKDNSWMVTVFLVPSGWSFPNEIDIGRAMKYYGMSKDTVITTEGLFRYVRSRLQCETISLETVIRELQRKEERSKAWYFRLDGHWTPYAHEMLAKWLAERYRRQHVDS